jgi:hypothetical protein
MAHELLEQNEFPGFVERAGADFVDVRAAGEVCSVQSNSEKIRHKKKDSPELEELAVKNSVLDYK